MSELNFSKNIKIAKNAAKEAGKVLLNKKDSLNQSIYSSDKDIKLKADIKAENIIKSILEKESSIPA